MWNTDEEKLFWKYLFNSQSNKSLFQITKSWKYLITILCIIYLCIIEYIYYKYDKIPIELIDCVCEYIYTNDTFNRTRVRVSLCYIYYLALHDYYNEAYDLMLMNDI